MFVLVFTGGDSKKAENLMYDSIVVKGNKTLLFTIFNVIV